MRIYYIGMDIHKKKISYCIKTASGVIKEEGSVSSNRVGLGQWVSNLPHPWVGGWRQRFLQVEFMSPMHWN